MASNEAPLYRDQERAPTSQGAPGLGVVPVPSFPTGADVGSAIEKLGNAGEAFAIHMREARQDTQVATATTDFVTKLHALEQEQTNNQDFKNAPQQFNQQRDQLISEATGQIADPKKRAELNLRLTNYGLTAQGRVEKQAIANESDVNAAALDQLELTNLREAAAAGSPAERQAIVDRNKAAILDAAGAGWITAQKAGDRQTRFNRYLENSDAMALIRDRPDKAIDIIRDPKNFPTLDPITRESYVASATTARDQASIDRLQALSRTKPEMVSLALGQVQSPQQGATIFSRGIVPIESAGDPQAESSKGAVGLTQILPGTARDMAARIGRTDIVALDDTALKRRLKDDSALNLRLGQQYWQDMLTRYDGNVVLAAAAYNAGPREADRWQSAAQAQFGDRATPAQIASVIDYRETQDYVKKLYGRFGAPLEGVALSPHAYYRAVNTVGASLDEQRRQVEANARAMASSARSEDPLLEILKQQFPVSPERVTDYLHKQDLAASAGDAAAATAARDVRERLALKPYIDEAYTRPPVEVNGTVAQLEALTRASGDTSGETFRRLTAFKEVAQEIEAKKNSEPVALLERAYPKLGAVAIDPRGDPDSASFQGALSARGQQAQQAQGLYLGSFNPFKATEVGPLKQRVAEGSADDRAKLLFSFARNMPGPVYDAAVSQVFGGSGVEAFAGRVAKERPELAREILHGAELMATPEAKDKAALIRPALQNKIGGELYPSPEMQSDVVNAALALYTSRRGGAGALYDATDTAGIEKAVEDVAGKIVKRNGARVAAPPGMTTSQFTDALDRLDKDTLRS